MIMIGTAAPRQTMFSFSLLVSVTMSIESTMNQLFSVDAAPSLTALALPSDLCSWVLRKNRLLHAHRAMSSQSRQLPQLAACGNSTSCPNSIQSRC